MEPSFSAKVLLFGEYSVLAGSDACAFPLERFSGRLAFPEPYQEVSQNLTDSNQGLKKLLDYLLNPRQLQPAEQILDLRPMAEDIKSGLVFVSNLPRNYGTGSSGALTAAIYQKYRRNDISEDIDSVRNHLAFIESAFHSKSSGIDPLVSYLKKAIFIRKENIVCSDLSLDDLRSHLNIELIDSGIPGKTKTGVTNFLSNYLSDPSKMEIFTNRYIPLVNEIIQSIYEGNFERIIDKIRSISEYQLRLFPELFTPEMTIEARSGLESGKNAIKLCGSGGGGFYLKFSL